MSVYYYYYYYYVGKKNHVKRVIHNEYKRDRNIPTPAEHTSELYYIVVSRCKIVSLKLKHDDNDNVRFDITTRPFHMKTCKHCSLQHNK